VTFHEVVNQGIKTPHSLELQQDKARARMAAALLLGDNTPLYSPDSAKVFHELLNARALYEEWIVD
jgi:hypothetical protein